MRRRDVIATAGAALALPATARGQAGSPPLIGFVRSTGAADSADQVAAFRRGLGEAGFVEGRDVVIDFRWAEGRLERLPGLVAEILDRRAAVIVVNGDATPAARAATATIPIVFVSGGDPVRTGLVTNLARPGGNVTGVAFVDSDVAAKRLGILHELTPPLGIIAVLTDPAGPDGEADLKSAEQASRTIGRRILVVRASNDAEIDAAFGKAVGAGALAVFVGVGSFYAARSDRIAVLAARHRLPAISAQRRFAEAGGLMSYGPSAPDAYRRAGTYVARILRGAKPADLPIELPTKFELVINQRAAKAIDFEVPASLLLIADEVIE